MAKEAVYNESVVEMPPRVSEWRRFRRVFFSRGVVVFGMVIIVLFVLVAIFAPFVAPYPSDIPDTNNVLQDPSAAHWLGTDQIGRDTLSRVIWGTRTSLEIGLIVVAIATIVGMTLGTLAGYFGGWTYNIIMRFIDALMAFPMILLALVIAALLGGGMKNVIIALSISLMPAYARLMCGQVLTVKENDYILAEKAIGCQQSAHYAAACSPQLPAAHYRPGHHDAGLDYSGGSRFELPGHRHHPPTPAWGSMVSDGRDYLLQLPILSFAPGLALMLVVFAFNMVGDGLRDALDPRLRGQL